MNGINQNKAKLKINSSSICQISAQTIMKVVKTTNIGENEWFNLQMLANTVL